MLDMTEALRPSELFALRWRSFDDQNTLTLTETVYRRTLRPFGKTPGSLTKVHLPDGLADELLRWKMECKKTSCKSVLCTKPEHRRASPDEFIFQNADGGFMDADNYRFRVLKPLAESLGVPKLNFQVMRRTMATQAQKMGSVKDIQAHLRHSRPDTTAHEYMQELPESVQTMVGSVYAMLMKGGENQSSDDLPQKAANASTVTPPKLLKGLVGTAGFEPTTSTV
ncbi:MAG: site-specific integrase [Acidobacteriaceae bacterium]|nr:site-specific integrase [Acidobacteriaceae bacterium]